MRASSKGIIDVSFANLYNLRMANWTEEKLLELIKNKVEESLTLEYKQCASLHRKSGKSNRDREMTELSKDVSSFANAAGGRIIYGVIEKDNLPLDLDAGFDAKQVSKEWIENVITSRIQRKIEGVEIHPVSLSESRSGQCAYVIEIPQSSTVHQAHDKRYYRRRNFKAEPMEDYEVREGLSRSKVPELAPQFKWETLSSTQDRHDNVLMISLKNVGSIRAKDVMFELEFPNEAIAEKYQRNFLEKHTQSRTLETDMKRIGNRNYVSFRLRTNEVIFPTEEVSLEKYGLKLEYKVTQHVYDMRHKFFVRWCLYADDELPKRGEFPLDDIQNF